MPIGVTTAFMLILERGMRDSGPAVKYDRNGGEDAVQSGTPLVLAVRRRVPELMGRLLLRGGVVEVAGDESLDARVQVTRGSFTA